MFAGSVMLGDLDDFISPSQACINPLFTDSSASLTTKNKTKKKNNDDNNDKGIAKINLLSDLGSSLLYDTAIKPNLIKSIPTSSLSSSSSSTSSVESSSTSGTARVTLNDCLACSGCVTSAETVLIQQQSMEEIFKAINNPSYELIIVSISPQALASIAAHCGISSMVETFERLSTYLYSIGVHAVLDTQVALDCVLVEEIHQFIRKLQTLYTAGTTPATTKNSSIQSNDNNGWNLPKGKSLRWETPPYSVGVSATRIRPFQDKTNTASGSIGSSASSLSSSSSYIAPLFATSNAPQPIDITEAPIPGTTTDDPSSLSSTINSSSSQSILPQLSSSCPGWICYAEKTVPEILPYVSTLKSPQQILGTLIKLLVSQGSVSCPRQRNLSNKSVSIDPSRIFHATIMPCYDKKLESSRRDFYWENDSLITTLLPFKEVTSVLSSPMDDGEVKEVDCVVTALEMVDLLMNGSPKYQGINTLMNDPIMVPIPSHVSLKDIPRTSRQGYLYATERTVSSPSSPSLPDIEEIFCSINPVTQRFSGGISSHSESDGYVSYLIRYLGLQLQGTLQRTGSSSSVSSRTPSTTSIPSTVVTSSSLTNDDSILLFRDFSSPLPFTPSRTNNDLKEIILNISYQALQSYQFTVANSSVSSSVLLPAANDQDIQIPLVFATAYGFRNIQAIINKLKRTRNNQNVLTSSSSASLSVPSPPAYAYVEIMACPQGCINGGGLVKVDIESARLEKDNDRNIGTTTTTSSSLKALADAQKQRIQQVNSLVHTSERSPSNRTPFDTFEGLLRTVPLLRQIYEYRQKDTTTSSTSSNRAIINYSVPWQYIFHTRYHAIPPLETNIVKW